MRQRPEHQPSIGGGMQAWTEKLKEVDRKLSQDLARPREEGYRQVEEMGLPHFKRVVLPVETFFKKPEAVFGQFNTDHYFVFLKPTEGLPVRKIHLTKQEAMDFISQNVAQTEAEDWELTITESYEQRYGGNILVSDDGCAVVEFRKGNQGPISAGTVIPEYSAWQDAFTGVWKYSFEDEALRRQVQDTMRTLPHEGAHYQGGLYEFQWISENDDDALKPRFIDYHPHVPKGVVS